MSQDEQDQCIGRAHRQRKDVQHKLDRLRRVAAEMGGRLVALGKLLQNPDPALRITKETAGFVARCKSGTMYLLVGDGESIPYPQEEHLATTLAEIGQLQEELERLNHILT